MIRRAIAEINLSHLASNFREARKTVGKRKIICVVKADAYGHGAAEVARRLEREGAFAFGVACVSEGIGLREAGIRSPVLVFFDNERVEDYFRHGLTPVLFDEDSAGMFSESARRKGTIIPVHVKIDTGMGRVGFLPETALEKILGISRLEGIRIQAVMSHFSEADLQDRRFAEEQLSIFSVIVADLRRKGIDAYAHMANSAAVISFGASHLDAVRPGLMLYGYSHFGSGRGLLPVMKLKTNLLSVRSVPSGTPISYARTFVTKRPSLIGVVPVGYADGFCRAFSNKAEVLIRGKKAPVVGRVCMDLLMVDATEIENVRAGDEVILLSDDPRSGLTAHELSVKAGTIPYELLISFGSRSGRVYVE